MLLLVSYSLMPAQLTVKGTVYSKGKPLKGVSVSPISQHSQTARSSKSGSFQVNSSGTGDHLVFKKRGYFTLSVLVNDTQHLVVNMPRANTKLFRRFRRQRRSKCPPSNPLCGCCFLPGTKIWMGNGSQKNIETLKPGDLVLTVNLDNFSLQVDTLRRLDSVVHRNLVELQLENGGCVTSTTDHPYYLSGKGWGSADPDLTRNNYRLRAARLEKGDSVKVYEAGQLRDVKVTELRFLEKESMTYNLSELSRYVTYLANGILVSTEKENTALTEK